MKLVVIMPAYNEEQVIGEVIESIPQNIEGFADIDTVVVDDGSSDNTNRIASNYDVTVLRHNINRGLGGALGTGLEYAKLTDADVAVTFDSDGQHAPEDIEKVTKPIREGQAEVVIGSRLLDTKGMPKSRIIGNWGLSLITYFLFGTWTTDSQSGLRAFSKTALQKINITSNKMEVSSEFIKQTGEHKLVLKEVPIKSVYTEYSLAKGQSNWNGFNIVAKLIMKRLKG